VVSLYKPSIKNTTYTITVSDIFKHQVSGSVYYESIIPEADFTFEHQVVDKVDNGTVTPRWDAVNEADSISAIALVKFKNASTNAQKYIWTLTDTLLGKYTPEQIKIDTADLSYSPEYKYYIPRSYKPMLIAINTKQGCRDTVVYKTDDENTKKFLVNIGNSTFFQTSGEMPNVFTPNGDGENDYYRPELRSVKSFHMYVYNRLGRKIYEYAHNENEPLDLWPGWDGKLSNGDMIKQGTYVIVIQARGWDGVAYRTKKYSSLVAVF
jgi:gliding motility-associated-like protein